MDNCGVCIYQLLVFVSSYCFCDLNSKVDVLKFRTLVAKQSLPNSTEQDQATLEKADQGFPCLQL